MDLAVNMDSTANAYVLAGGTLKASVDTHDGQRQIASGDGAIVLTADSTVDAAANFGMISSSYAANELDLAGHTLTKTGSANFYLANTTVTAGTIKIAEGTLNVTNHDTTDASAADIVIAGGTLHVGGNFLLKSVSGETGTLNIANGTNVIGSADFAGTTTIRGGNTTFSGSAEFVDIDLKGGTLNIAGDSVISNGITSETGTLVVGDGENSALVSVGRLELGNSNGGSSAFTVNAGATLTVTGSENTWNDYTNYKTNSAVLGEWNNYTTTTIAGTLLAKDAVVGLGDYGGTFTIENGGLIAAKGIGQATSAKAGTGKFELTLNDGGTLLLGTSGLSTTKTTNTVSLAAGTIGTFADSTTVATALTLTSETGTTFDTQKYVFADDGNSVTRGEDAAAMTVSGAISGTGNFIKTGAGTLTLSNNFGSFEGNFIVNGGELLLSGSNSGYSGQFVVNGGTLKLGTTSGVLGTTDLEGTGTRYAAVVNAGGTLDINGQTQGGNNCYQIELAGGSLINNGSGVGTDQRQITGLKLSADSEIGGSGNFGLIASGYAANTLDLGGNTLTKTGTNTFWLASTTVTAGTFKIQEGKVEVVSQTLSSVDASAAQFTVEGGE
ncbi:MAG: hypothetical protein IJW39_03430, partial [Opitutales bacterium]|nr:hypothetical protein [Opitutales bacterium]